MKTRLLILALSGAFLAACQTASPKPQSKPTTQVPATQVVIRADEGRTGEVKQKDYVLQEAVMGRASMEKSCNFRAYYPPPYQPINTEAYDVINENGFHTAKVDPLSTFSIDVDVASYANMRRFLNSNQLPPKDAIRTEELINYFSYNYPQPTGGHPFSITTEIGSCPWSPDHKLMLVGLQGKNIATENLPPSNLVFLIDVSGSMASEDKLPLLKSSFNMLVKKLRPQDKIAMVVYAGSAGLVLPSTRGNQKDKILAALSNLEAGGSTAGGAGIQLAYSVARENFIRGGINRVILATDGDFNVGVSNDEELVRIIEEKRKSGVSLSVLGFGTGNLKDSRMEKLADKGNGNYAYIDNLLEAKKVLVSEMSGTLNTIAKDVKIQVEFNPAQVQAYRLIGYENRMLNKEDFNNDKKDAGEIGAGHEVTALYEIVPVGVEMRGSVDPLKYQKTSEEKIADAPTVFSNELATVKFRYKKPDGDKSILLSEVVSKEGRLSKDSENLRFATAVAGFSMLLRDSDHKGSLTYGDVLKLAKGAIGEDANDTRAEFVRLVKLAETLSESSAWAR